MASLTNRLGYFNPQYLRECRGRLKPRNVMAAVVLSGLFQALLYLSIANSYDYEGRPSDAFEIFRALSSIIPYALFALGGYYIVDDLAHEARTGTLNFIRLSPRPAREILIGKLLGVPMLPLLLVISTLPMHVVSGLMAGASPLLLLSYYLIVATGAVTVFTMALLTGLGSGASKLTQQRGVSAIAFAGLTLFTLSPAFTLWNSQITWQTVTTGEQIFRSWDETSSLYWMALNIGRSALFSHLFVLGNFAVVSTLVWRTAVRKFRVPRATLLSRQVGYLSMIYLNVLVFGFFIGNGMEGREQFEGVITLYFLNAFALLALIFALSPSRQQLLDWVSYRAQARRTGHASSAQGLWRSLVWSDISPSVGAIALNALIAAAVIVPAAFIFGQGRLDYYDEPIPDITAIALLFATRSIGISSLTYATLVQVIFSSRLRSPLVWAVGTVATIAIVPPLALAFLDIMPDSSVNAGTLWTFLGLPLFGNAHVQVPSIGWVGLLGQLCLLGLLLGRLNQNLKQLEAQSKKVLQEA
ncbi:MAG: ABC transporter permease [Phormidesmis sp.]